MALLSEFVQLVLACTVFFHNNAMAGIRKMSVVERHFVSKKSISRVVQIKEKARVYDLSVHNFVHFFLSHFPLKKMLVDFYSVYLFLLLVWRGVRENTYEKKTYRVKQLLSFVRCKWK